jgi:iron complex outermembrane receptor protein
LRYEHYSNYNSTFLPGLGINLKGSFWQLYFTGSKNYRLPTFNELYWQPGGNPDLNVEKSVNLETGIEFNKSFGRVVQFEVHTALYQNKVKDQIKWLPDGSIWSPQNISQVLSRGIEMETVISDIKKLHIVKFNYRYGNSEKQKAEFDGDETVGKQLPFLPREQWYLDTQSGWRSLRFGFTYSDVSFRYKTIQNESDQILSSYSVLDFWIGHEFSLDKNRLNLSLAIKNLLNENYQVMDGYPMPWRNYTLTLSTEY